VDYSFVEMNDDDMFAEIEYCESLVDEIQLVQRRALKFADWLRNRSEDDIVVVSHSGFIRSFLANILGLNCKYQQVRGIGECESISILYDGSKWEVITPISVVSIELQ
jgi:broad specificity phosphatase PhoE